MTVGQIRDQKGYGVGECAPGQQVTEDEWPQIIVDRKLHKKV